MKIKEQIKKFCFKVWNKIGDHLATCVAGGIILLCIIILKWLKTTHSLEIPGWGWVLCVVSLVGVPVIVSIVIHKFRTQKKKMISDSKDIQILLDKWWTDWKSNAQPTYNKTDPNLAAKFISEDYYIKCSEVDDQLKLKKGSAIKYLPGIIDKDVEYQIIEKGKDILKLIKRMPPSPAAQEYAKLMSKALRKGSL
jgi:hypothetical protein